MQGYREKIYDVTYRHSKSRELTSILVRAYKHNLSQAYKTLINLPKDEDRLALLKYVDKTPFLSEAIIQKIVETFLFYRVTLQNPVYKRIYMTNNRRCEIHTKYNEMRKLSTILERAYGHDLEQVKDVLDALPNEKDKLRLLKYIDKTPYLSNNTIRKIVTTYLFYRVTLRNEQEFIKAYKTNNFALLENEDDRALLKNFVASLNRQR